ncbi:hypothetical protein BGZ94_003931 [Podila epigama]|nr:hypothetical protein BGZ94_003931 [Podila epigama]
MVKNSAKVFSTPQSEYQFNQQHNNQTLQHHPVQHPWPQPPLRYHSSHRAPSFTSSSSFSSVRKFENSSATPGSLQAKNGQNPSASVSAPFGPSIFTFTSSSTTTSSSSLTPLSSSSSSSSSTSSSSSSSSSSTSAALSATPSTALSAPPKSTSGSADQEAMWKGFACEYTQTDWANFSEKAQEEDRYKKNWTKMLPPPQSVQHSIQQQQQQQQKPRSTNSITTTITNTHRRRPSQSRMTTEYQSSDSSESKLTTKHPSQETLETETALAQPSPTPEGQLLDLTGPDPEETTAAIHVPKEKPLPSGIKDLLGLEFCYTNSSSTNNSTNVIGNISNDCTKSINNISNNSNLEPFEMSDNNNDKDDDNDKVDNDVEGDDYDDYDDDDDDDDDEEDLDGDMVVFTLSKMGQMKEELEAESITWDDLRAQRL